MNYETVIGLEIHVELATQSKIYCGCSTEFGADENMHVCPGCYGMPGTLPALNEKVVEYCIRAGLALDMKNEADLQQKMTEYLKKDAAVEQLFTLQ